MTRVGAGKLVMKRPITGRGGDGESGTPATLYAVVEIIAFAKK